MTDSEFCLQITVPPAGQEDRLLSALMQRFTALSPDQLQPFFDTGDPLYLTGTDRPSGLLLAQELQAAGLEVVPGRKPAHLHRECSLVAPHPQQSGERLIVSVARIMPPAPTTALVVSLPPAPDLPPALARSERCRRCHEGLLTMLAFCPSCGYWIAGGPPAAPAPVAESPRPALRNKVRLVLGASAVILILPINHGIGAFLVMGLAAAAYLGPDLVRRQPQTVDPESAAPSPSCPFPGMLVHQLQQALEAPASDALRLVVSRVVLETAGIFGSLATADAISQSLLKELTPQLTAVVQGLLNLVARGHQIEQYAQVHNAGSLDQERRRLERLRDGTADEPTRANYALALLNNEKARKSEADMRVAGGRLASQLLLLLTGLTDIRSRVTLASLREAGGSADARHLTQRLRELQKEARAIDEGLATFFENPAPTGDQL